MPNVSTQIVRLSNFPPTIPNVPPNYPMGPAPGKLQLLLNSNSNYLYHKFNPYTNYNDSLLGGILSDKQPFVYTYIDEAQNSTFNKLPAAVKGLASIANVTPGTLNDVVRVSKFLISSHGIQFLITQMAIQRLASFDETRLFNPLSPVLATIAPMTLGIGSRPTRHIEGGLLGLANSVTSTVGINLTSGYAKPTSTAGDKTALPTYNTTPGSSQGKGMVRGTDAASGLTNLKSRWVAQSSGGSTGIGGLLSTIGASFSAFFGGAPKSEGTYRADEKSADMMYNTKNNYYVGTSGTIRVRAHWLQPWYNNANTGEMPGKFVKIRPIAQGIINNTIIPLFQYQTLKDIKSKTIIDKYGNALEVGYEVGTNGNAYFDSIYLAKDGEFTNSDTLINFADYTDPEKPYVTKLADPLNDQVINTNKALQNVMDRFKSSQTYNATSAVLSSLLPSGLVTTSDKMGYNRLNSLNTKDSVGRNELEGNSIDVANTIEIEYKYGSPGVLDDKTVPKSIDETFKRVGGTSLRMATTFKSDGINTLGILSKDKIIGTNTTYKDWVEYQPYEDDLIAFFFYDVVNEKYIPFRATVKGISEGNTAFWDELRFIGRSDQVYSYNGFSRTLSFTFNVVIGSVNELMPSWKKINYIASAVKPSNYTTGQKINQSYNRFIVPPMFMLTIGDLYKFQPMVITSINVNIPDDASWETLNENNSSRGWSYLNGIVTAPDLGKNYGQLPREAEIAITCNLLEKERAVVGGSHFGHEPRVDDWEGKDIGDRFKTSHDEFLPMPTTLHQNFVEWNNPGTVKK